MIGLKHNNKVKQMFTFDNDFDNDFVPLGR